MAQDMKENGKRISNTVKELKHGQMVPVMKETTLRVKSTDKGNSLGQMVVLIRVSLLKTILMDMVIITYMI